VVEYRPMQLVIDEHEPWAWSMSYIPLEQK
jgi:hypothetical protein